MSTKISFEFFPPKTTAGMENLVQISKELFNLNPNFFSVTFGALATDYQNNNTFNTVKLLKEQLSTPIAPHISCINQDTKEVLKLLECYKQLNITDLVVIRGDKIENSTATNTMQYAYELVELIRQEYGQLFNIKVAAYPEIHPEALSANDDFAHFINKMSCGVNAAITQYFYNIDAYFYFVERCAKNNITQDIIPGIMPISSFEKINRFSKICGAEIPRWLSYKLQDYQDNSYDLQQFAKEFISKQCETLLARGVPGLHFYTLNSLTPSLEIAKSFT